MTWANGTKLIRAKVAEINALMGSDVADCIEESTRCSELLRKFRNRMIHGFLGEMNNGEGWIELRPKLLEGVTAERITRDQTNEHASLGDAAMQGYKQILLRLYHKNGKMS